jgi:hypothetical protein
MQDTDVITNEANKNQSALAIQPEDVIPSTLFRPEVESRMKENIQGSHSNELDARVKVLQESELNEVCNEAYDELVATQDRVFPHYVPNSSIKHSKSDSKDRSQEIL